MSRKCARSSTARPGGSPAKWRLGRKFQSASTIPQARGCMAFVEWEATFDCEADSQRRVEPDVGGLLRKMAGIAPRHHGWMTLQAPSSAAFGPCGVVSGRFGPIFL